MLREPAELQFRHGLFVRSGIHIEQLKSVFVMKDARELSKDWKGRWMDMDR